jgi:tetratricopeptide (TPR) repeat protein
MLLLFCACGCDVNPAERNNAGNALYNQGQYDSAIAAYQAAQVAAPDNSEAYYNAACAYAQQGDYDKAISALQQALITTNADLKTRSYYNLGNIYFQMGRFDSAVDAYQKALLLNPTDEDARHNLELAIKRLVLPSPTAISPTSQPTHDGNNAATPTSELSGQLTSVASSTPDISMSQPENLTSTPFFNGLPVTISVKDAESILDAVQQAQQALPTQSLSGTPSASNAGKDW